jgi:hypothetical protein
MNISFADCEKSVKSDVYYDKLDEIFGILSAPEIDSKMIISDDNEAFKFWFENRTLYLKLRGGADDTLSNTCQELIGLMVKDSYSLHILAKALRENLILDNIIGEETTYQDIMNNGKLKSMLYNTVKLFLSDSLVDSKFGGGIVTDFDLIINLQVTKYFYDKMKELKIAEGTETFDKLKAARGVVRRFVTKIRDGIIIMMDLPETPTKEDMKKDKESKKKAKTKEDVKESIEKSKETLKRSQNADISISSNDVGNFLADVNSDTDEDSMPNVELMELCEKRKFLGQRSSENAVSLLDDYATHRDVVEPLIEHLGLNKQDFIIWDPCCGRLNAICKLFKQIGFETIQSDIQNLEGEDFTHIDFLNHEDDGSTGTLIITNPPWSQNKKFLHKLVSMNGPFCCLLKLEVLGTKYFKNVLTSKSKDYSFHGLPLPKGRFYCVETGKDIQMSGVFWLIGNYIPKGYESALEQSEFIRTCPLIMKNLTNENEDNIHMET